MQIGSGRAGLRRRAVCGKAGGPHHGDHMSRPLHVAFHVGVHATDGDHLWRSLAQNAAALRAQGCELCENAINEPILNEALATLKGGTASAEMEEVILDALVEGEQTRRLIMSRPSFLGVPSGALSVEGMMPYAGNKMLGLANTLPNAQAEFFMGLKNPVTLINQLVARNPAHNAPLAARHDPMGRRWAPTLRHAVQALRGRRLVVWCHEDMPLIYPEVLRRLAGVEADMPLKGDMRLLDGLLTEAGVQALRAGLVPDMGSDARRTLIETVLAAHVRPERLRAEITVPDWTPELVAGMTEAYHRDIAEIAALPGVEFIAA